MKGEAHESQVGVAERVRGRASAVTHQLLVSCAGSGTPVTGWVVWFRVGDISDVITDTDITRKLKVYALDCAKTAEGFKTENRRLRNELADTKGQLENSEKKVSELASEVRGALCRGEGGMHRCALHRFVLTTIASVYTD